MVYDEGFQLNHDDVVYFAFSKYKTDYAGVYSYCGETLIGWFNNQKTKERGCYRASKKNSKNAQTEAANNGHVVQPLFVVKLFELFLY